jgi:RimJ/RimL family protein N-acetyltransferase
VLDTPRLRLRPLAPGDCDAYAALLADEEAMRYLGGPVGAAEAARRLDALTARHAADGLGALAVERRDDGRLIGRVGFWIWSRRDWTGGWTRRELGGDAVVELGWILERAAWGHGYATEAARAVLRHGFHDHGLDRIVSLIDARNEPSLRVAERLAATYETDVVTPRWGALRLYRHARPAADRATSSV